MALVAMALAEEGHVAESYTGSYAGVLTTSVHDKAKIVGITPGRIRQALDEGVIAIVAGFQGIAHDTKEVTLGRGGARARSWPHPSATPPGPGAARAGQINEGIDDFLT